ncbi:hypothetical protein [Fictibacillus phosphorivorans]|uniref:hypothetical protein n=1 Tax=Fictibacillus phosphorivorans TaxID=1221500 RepID=UPI0011A293C0|nr:hypothetical protein [Fictibacillus phosphorivorans]
MFLRMYLEAKHEAVVMQIAEKVLGHIKLQRISKQVIKPYWKIKGIYVFEVEMVLQPKISENDTIQALLPIAENWITFEDSLNEFLVSDTADGCKIKLPEIKMINIHF